jgi:hypothetical protein
VLCRGLQIREKISANFVFIGAPLPIRRDAAVNFDRIERPPAGVEAGVPAYGRNSRKNCCTEAVGKVTVFIPLLSADSLVTLCQTSGELRDGAA